MAASKDSSLGAKQKLASFGLTFICYSSLSAGSEKTTDALRAYATWLVRATRQKMGTSEPENIDNKSRINLTKDGELR
jgi:hypothetical protein